MIGFRRLLSIRINSFFNRPWAIGIIIFSVSILAFIAGLIIMHYGVGISPDSTCYIDTARNIQARLSLSCLGHPLTRFPPGYPLLLAVVSVFGSDPLDTAFWLQAFIYGLSSALVAFLVYLSTNKSGPAAIIAQLLFILSPNLLTVHTMAWSEPPYILFLLLTFLFFILYIKRPGLLWLLGFSILVSLILLTRFIGVSVIPAVILAILFQRNLSLKKRLKDSCIFLVVASFPLSMWIIGMKLSTGSLAGRSMVFHPMSTIRIPHFISTVVNFILPNIPLSGLSAQIIFTVILTLILLGIYLSIKGNGKDKPQININCIIQSLCVFYIITYLLILFLSVTYFDASTIFDYRILAPVYVAGIILVFSTTNAVSNLFKKPYIWRLFVSLMVILILVNASQFRITALKIYQYGRDYSSPSWTKSKSIIYVNSLPKEISIYSNAPDAIYFLTGKPASYLPNKSNSTTSLSNPNFLIEMINLKDKLNQKDTYVVFMNGVQRNDLPTSQELTEIYHFPVLLKLNDGIIFGITQ
jgi:4-amino-4-deoxy-L-arabinose transferase-like glycosyltransferase